jgi:glycerol-3-phosphate dehydrogenase (NAD(P)+)
VSISPILRGPQPVAVLGAGSWGTALAGLLAKAGHDVRLWAFEEDVVAEIREHGENRTFLPDAPLPPNLTATGDLADAVSGRPFVLSVTPSQFVDRVIAGAAPHIDADAVVISASKGIETSTLRRMDQVCEAHLSPLQAERFSVLSGPSFAREVADEQPTAVVVASHDQDARLRVQALFQTPYFRVYTNSDVVGVEMGGALKNVIALAAGVVAGLGFGHNTTAALITRGVAEMARLGLAMGASRETFAGLAGMGDLVLTCTGGLSRNRTVGYELGSGRSLDEVLGGMKQVAEGVKTAEAVYRLSQAHGVEMPICGEVYAILYEGRSPAEAVRNLMMRDPKPEEWS